MLTWRIAKAGSLIDLFSFSSLRPRGRVGAFTSAPRLKAKIDRQDLSGVPLLTAAFNPDDPKVGEPRLRFSEHYRSKDPRGWTNAHQGAMHFGQKRLSTDDGWCQAMPGSWAPVRHQSPSARHVSCHAASGAILPPQAVQPFDVVRREHLLIASATFAFSHPSNFSVSHPVCW